MALDLSNYFARKTCEHVRASIGQGQRFADGAFNYSATLPSEVPIQRDYRLTFADMGDSCWITLDHNHSVSGDINGLVERIKSSAHVPRKYKEVAKSVDISTEGDRILLKVKFVHKSTSSGRTVSQEKLFYAVYNSGIRHTIDAVLKDSST